MGLAVLSLKISSSHMYYVFAWGPYLLLTDVLQTLIGLAQSREIKARAQRD